MICQAVRRNSSVFLLKLKAATPTEIERMGGNCAICWVAMSVPGSASGRRQQTLLQEKGVDATAKGASYSQEVRKEAAVAVVAADVVSEATMSSTDSADQPPRKTASIEDDSLKNFQNDLRRLAAVATTSAAEGHSEEEEDEAAGEGFSLPCGHAYHHDCLHQWLRQCHSQGTTPVCPMCQAVIKLEVKWLFPFFPWRGHDDHQTIREALEQQPVNQQLIMNPNIAVNPDELQMFRLLDHQR